MRSSDSYTSSVAQRGLTLFRWRKGNLGMFAFQRIGLFPAHLTLGVALRSITLPRSDRNDSENT
jgi:hypothetical protein